MNKPHFAAYAAPDISHTTLVVGPGYDNDPTLNLQHEYVHYHLRSQRHAYPLWYEEGLASLLSVARAEPKAGGVEVVVGRDLPSKLARSQGPQPSLATLFTTEDIENWALPRVTGFYKRSSETVRYLLYGEDIDEQTRASVARYLVEREPGLLVTLDTTADDLARRVRAHGRDSGRAFDRLFVEDEANYGDTSGRVLSEEERLNLWAQTAVDHNPRYAERLYKRLVKLDPTSPSYLARWAQVLADRDLDRAEDVFARARTISGEDAEVKFLEAVLIVRRCPLFDATLSCHGEWREAVTSLRMALAANPDHFQAILMLGMIELYTGNAGAALNYLRIAHTRAPWSAQTNYHLGEALRLLGNPRAEAHLRQALAWARDEYITALATKSLELLAEDTNADATKVGPDTG